MRNQKVLGIDFAPAVNGLYMYVKFYEYIPPLFGAFYYMKNFNVGNEICHPYSGYKFLLSWFFISCSFGIQRIRWVVNGKITGQDFLKASNRNDFIKFTFNFKPFKH